MDLKLIRQRTCEELERVKDSLRLERFPSAEARVLSVESTRLEPSPRVGYLFSYLEIKGLDDQDPIVLGVTCRFALDIIHIETDISREESGEILFSGTDISCEKTDAVIGASMLAIHELEIALHDIVAGHEQDEGNMPAVDIPD